MRMHVHTCGCPSTCTRCQCICACDVLTLAPPGHTQDSWFAHTSRSFARRAWQVRHPCTISEQLHSLTPASATSLAATQLVHMLSWIRHPWSSIRVGVSIRACTMVPRCPESSDKSEKQTMLWQFAAFFYLRAQSSLATTRSVFAMPADPLCHAGRFGEEFGRHCPATAVPEAPWTSVSAMHWK